MTPVCGIRSAAKRLALTVAVLAALGAFWSASAFAQSAPGTSPDSLVGNVTQAVGEATGPGTATAQSTVPTATAAASTATTTTTASIATTATSLTSVSTDAVQPLVDTVATTVETASESLSSTSQSALDPLVTSLAGGALPPTVQDLVTTVGTPAAPPPVHPVAGSSNPVATRRDEQPTGPVDVIAPAFDSAVAPVAAGRAVAAPQGREQVDHGSPTTLGRAPRAHLSQSGVATAPVFGDLRELTFSPGHHVTAAHRGRSLPRIPDMPGGVLDGTSATGGSGSSTGLVAALMAALLLAVPRVARWLRPAAATRPLPILQLSLERPG